MKNSIRLIQFEEKYYSLLYPIYGEQAERLCVLPQKQYITFEQFQVNFKKHIESKYAMFKIIRDDEHEFLGFVIAYDHYRNDGHLKVSVYILPEYRSVAYGFIAIAKFIDDLFKYYSLNKIFTEVYAFNTDSSRMHEVFGFKHEATLEKFKYYNGEYHNMHIYSIEREAFYARIAQMGNILG